MLLMIDNYDSFTYNLVQYFAELGEDVRVFRNDEIDVAGIAALGRVTVSLRRSIGGCMRELNAAPGAGSCATARGHARTGSTRGGTARLRAASRWC